tara:strand:- start:8883 stop:9248 length:366 start_codon:yes stop_codon:yes gene_type:complete
MNTDIDGNIIFETGKTYEMRSVGDYNCVWRYKVVRRTMKTVILEADDREDGEGRKRIRIWQGVETVQPLGSYSMSPVLCADKPVQDSPDQEPDEDSDNIVRALKAGVAREYRKLTVNQEAE